MFQYVLLFLYKSKPTQLYQSSLSIGGRQLFRTLILLLGTLGHAWGICLYSFTGSSCETHRWFVEEISSGFISNETHRVQMAGYIPLIKYNEGVIHEL